MCIQPRMTIYVPHCDSTSIAAAVCKAFCMQLQQIAQCYAKAQKWSNHVPIFCLCKQTWALSGVKYWERNFHFQTLQYNTSILRTCRVQQSGGVWGIGVSVCTKFVLFTPQIIFDSCSDDYQLWCKPMTEWHQSYCQELQC